MATPSPRSSNSSQKQANRLAPLANVLALQSDRQTDQRQKQHEDASRLTDTTLSDDSISSSGDTGRASALDLGTKSYAATNQETPSTMGGGIQEDTTTSIAKTRQLQEAMTREREQLLGVKRVGDEGPEEATEAEEEIGEEEEIEDEEEEELNEAEEMMEAQSIEVRQQMELQQQRATEIQAHLAEEQALRKTRRMTNSGIRLAEEGAELASSEFIVPLLILILQLNVQMIMKYIFRPLLGGNIEKATAGAPWFDQSLFEDFLTINADILLTCGGICCNPCCTPFVLILIIAGILSSSTWAGKIYAVWMMLKGMLGS